MNRKLNPWLLTSSIQLFSLLLLGNFTAAKADGTVRDKFECEFNYQKDPFVWEATCTRPNFVYPPTRCGREKWLISCSLFQVGKFSQWQPCPKNYESSRPSDDLSCRRLRESFFDSIFVGSTLAECEKELDKLKKDSKGAVCENLSSRSNRNFLSRNEDKGEALPVLTEFDCIPQVPTDSEFKANVR
jgi:hypothetical protein